MIIRDPLRFEEMNQFVNAQRQHRRTMEFNFEIDSWVCAY